MIFIFSLDKNLKIMKQIVSIFLLFAFIQTHGQNKTTAMFIDKLSLVSSDSRIEVNEKGDTVLISEFANPNIKLQTNSGLTKTYKGTPFFNNGWFSGSMILDGSVANKGLMAFNLITNTLYFSVGEKQNAIEIKPDEFTIKGIVFRKYTKQYVAAGEIYYQKLVEGEFELFKQFYCKYNPRNVGDTNGYEMSGDGFEGYFEKELIYYTIYNNKMERVGKKFSVFGENEEKAKNFAKNNNLSLKKENDLIKIVKFLNQKTL